MQKKNSARKKTGKKKKNDGKKRKSAGSDGNRRSEKQASLKNEEQAAISPRAPLPHGRALAAEEFELEVGRVFSVERFASLCNAIAWCVGSRNGLPQLSFTERVNVSDNGIDAEWNLELPSTTIETPIAGSGWNVFQYKKRDVSAQGRKRPS